MKDRALKPEKILISKLGLDGHDRGAKYLTHSLQASGFKAEYSGLHKTPEEVARFAESMRADILGISILSGSHLPLIGRLFESIRERGLNDLVVIVGGIIPREDVESLKALGVAAVFGPSTPIADIVHWINHRDSLPKVS